VQKKQSPAKAQTRIWNLLALHLILNVDVSNKHICFLHIEKMRALCSFKFDTRVITSKNQKFFSIYFQYRNRTICKNAFSARQNAENEHQKQWNTSNKILELSLTIYEERSRLGSMTTAVSEVKKIWRLRTKNETSLGYVTKIGTVSVAFGQI